MEGKGNNPPWIRAVESKCISKPSKYLKKYKSPVQKFANLYGSSHSNDETPESPMPVDEAQTPQELDPLLDIKHQSGSNCNELEMLDFRLRIYKESIGGASARNTSCASEPKDASRKDSSNRAITEMRNKTGDRKRIMFEFTDSEDESNVSGKKDTGISLHYSCKHCLYSNVNIDSVAAHYQNHHPYVIYNQVYIEDPSDLSATFRCLICPLEFSTFSELKAHDIQNHPHSPGVLTIQSSDLSFKCFMCSFTCSALEEVKIHYNEEHPSYEVDSALKFCRYWVDTRKDEQPQLNDDVKAPVSNMPVQCSPNTRTSSRTEFDNVDVTYAVDNTLKCCRNPGDTRAEEQPHLNDCLPASMSEKPQQCSPNTSPLSSDKCNDVNIDSVPAHCQHDHDYVLHNKVNIQDSSDLSPTFECLTCPVELLTLSELKAQDAQNHPNFSFPKAPVSEIPQQCSPNTSPSSSKGALQNMPSNQHQSPVSQNMVPAHCVTTEVTSFNKTNDKYQSPEKLFYCQKCNYASLTAEGVVQHQYKIHHCACMEEVYEHTTKIRDEMKRLQSQAQDSSLTCQLPLPLLEEGDEHAFFCHLCNYRNDKMKSVMMHYLKMHDKWKIGCDQVKKHSLNIHKQIKDLRPHATSGHKVSQAMPNVEKNTSNRREKHHGSSNDSQQKGGGSEEHDDPDDSGPQSPRSEPEETEVLTCEVCLFKYTSLPAFLQHCHTAHPWSVKADGSLLSIITGRKTSTRKELENEKEITPTFESYQVPLEFESSPTRAESPTRIECNSCPESFSTQRCVDVHRNEMHHGGVTDNSDAEIAKPSITSSANLDLIDSPVHLFKCPYCSYVSSLLVGIFMHSSMVHPGLAITKENCYLQTENTLDFKKFAKAKGSSMILRGYMCKKCPQICDTKKMLSKHLQKDHCETMTDSQPEPQTLSLDKTKSFNPNLTSQSTKSSGGSMFQQANSEADDSHSTFDDDTVLVYQCPKCPYVNASDFGFFIHCQHKHPSLLVRAKEFQKEKTMIANYEVLKNEKRLMIGGYKCKKCLYIFYTAQQLNTHRKRDCSPKDNTPALDKTEENPNLPLPPRKDDSLYRCRVCPYKSFNRRYVFDHYRTKHKFSLKKRRKLLESDANDKSFRAEAANESDEVPNLEGETSLHPEVQSTQHLESHSGTVALSVGALDFIVLAKPSKKATGLYKCSHCGKQIRGTKRLSSHLDKHRDLAKKAGVDPTDDITAPLQDKPPTPETSGDLEPVGTFKDAQSPPTSPSTPQTPERVESLEKETSFACKHCSRIFKHQKSLASHERSHATVAALRKQTTDSTSTLKHSINKYILYKPENQRPFLCTLCRYRSSIVSLLRRHLLKKHESILRCIDLTDVQISDESISSKVASPTQMLNDLPENSEDVQTAEGPSYAEAPEVQRQLDLYSKMAKASDTSEARAPEEASPAASLLKCDLCRYSARCPPTLRKHYSSRHGKKMLMCKGCSFVTCSKKSMKVHSDMGHNCNRQLPAAAHQDDLSCPFCLYQTKNRNYMIDHIVLHREERIVPIEPCRPHLSRYLQGIVHRCHKCTFTSGSAEILRLHVTKHDNVNPYKCRLCYFDCTQLGDLEAHLSDKHQVLRNHELVGQIRLDEMEARLERTTPEEYHTVPKAGASSDCDNVSIGILTKTLADVEMDIEHSQDGDTLLVPAKLKNSEQEDPPQTQCLSDIRVEKEAELTTKREENVNCQAAARGHKIQLKPENDEEGNGRNPGLKEKVVQSFLGSPDKKPGFPHTERVFDAKIEEHILRCMLQLEKDERTVTKRRKSEVDVPVKDKVLVRNRLFFNNTSIMNPMKLGGVQGPSKFTFRRHSLAHGVYSAQHQFSSASVPFAAAKNGIETPGSYKNQGPAVKEHLVSCKENDHVDNEVTHLHKKPRYEEDSAIKTTENPYASEGAHSTSSFSCNLCGRKLVNRCQLERHIEQHGK